MSTPSPCPQCDGGNAYADGMHYVCPDCWHEWSTETGPEGVEDGDMVRDANGKPLRDGDSVVLIKDLKVKGSSTTLKMGTRIRGIRLTSDGDHEVDCRMDGGSFLLKACYLKKA